MEKKECKIEGCDKESKAKGLCFTHYDRQRRGETDMRPGCLPWKPDDPRYKNKGRLCDVPECKGKYYAKGLCHKHYASLQRKGFLACNVIFYGPCIVVECDRKAVGPHNLCPFHYRRKQDGIPLLKPKGVKGDLNPNWNGGVADYPNHYEMKKKRKVILGQAGYICHYCGKKATEVHHLDLSKDNHSLSNLVATCHKCNSQIRKPHTSKYKRMYGGSLNELADKLGVCISTVRCLHMQGKLNRAMFDREIQSVLF